MFIFTLRKDLLNIEPQLAFVHQKDRSVMHGLQNNHTVLRKILEGRSFGQRFLENYISNRKTKARPRQSQGKQLLSCGRK